MHPRDKLDEQTRVLLINIAYFLDSVGPIEDVRLSRPLFGTLSVAAFRRLALVITAYSAIREFLRSRMPRMPWVGGYPGWRTFLIFWNEWPRPRRRRLLPDASSPGRRLPTLLLLRRLRL